MIMRRIITKLLIRVGSAKVRQATAKEHLPLIAYVERARRKQQNIKERAKLLALMGQKATDDGGETKDDSDSALSASDEDEVDKRMDSDSESDLSSSDDEDDDALARGMDQLQSSAKFDIPIVRDIPVLS